MNLEYHSLEEFRATFLVALTISDRVFNRNDRPCVLIVKLKYKGHSHKFVVPIRSNIAANAPKEQYFALPLNPAIKSGIRYGVHYIKLFPINSKYIQKYRIDDNEYMQQVKTILDKNEKEIVEACQNYLNDCEQGKKNLMTSDIDGILLWLLKV